MKIYSHKDNFEKMYNYFNEYIIEKLLKDSMCIKISFLIIDYFERYFNLYLIFVCYRIMKSHN